MTGVPLDLAAARDRPIVTDDSIRAYAVEVGVCVRPLLRRLVDRETGDTSIVPLACGSTREHVCPSCAAAARRLRMQQCAEGWHLADEPPDPAPTDPDDSAQLDEDHDATEDQDDKDEDLARRTRSTRRRDDAADLPRLPVEDRTVGRTWTGNDGQTYQPSMFVTLTLPSYGRVDPTLGVPVDPSAYDYRRAALDALHFGRLFDRWMQNLRRCAGYKVQYFAAIEAQRRLAGHAHLAIRGAIPRATLRAVTRATYVQVWWPPHTTVVYDELVPTWDGEDYIDPDTWEPLPTWDQALAHLDTESDAQPVHVARFGTQVDIKGLTGGTPEVDRAVRYLTKYLTKSVAATHSRVDGATGQPVEDPRMTAHVDRLHRELRWLPCSERCANWLRYGIQPKTPGPGLTPGQCAAPAHDRENAGLGGRRVLASRKWTGKTLTDHRADRATVVREALTAAGIEAPERDRCAADVVCEDGTARYVWEPVDRDRDGSVDYAAAILAAARQRNTWRQQYEQAKRHNEPGPEPPDRACGHPFGNSDDPTDAGETAA